MLLCPAQYQTSPNATSVNDALPLQPPPAHEAVMVCDPPASAARSSAFQLPAATSTDAATLYE